MAIQSSESIDDSSPEKGFSKIIQSRFKRILTLPLGALLIMLLSFPSQAEEPKILNSSNTFSLEEWRFLGSSIATYYGNEVDGYLGRRHAASWHKATPPQFSEIVTSCCEPGVALTTAWGVDFGTEVLVVFWEKKIAVIAVRVDAKPGTGIDLYEWLYRLLSPQDVGPLEVDLYIRENETSPPSSISAKEEKFYELESFFSSKWKGSKPRKILFGLQRMETLF